MAAAAWIVRHGESAGNVARDAAHAAGHAVIDIAERDVDVPLSRLGEQQSRALGHWFAAQPEQPDVIVNLALFAGTAHGDADRGRRWCRISRGRFHNR